MEIQVLLSGRSGASRLDLPPEPKGAEPWAEPGSALLTPPCEGGLRRGYFSHGAGKLEALCWTFLLQLRNKINLPTSLSHKHLLVHNSNRF